MEPGIELDILIAEKVFGWSRSIIDEHLRMVGYLISDTMENDLPRFSPSLNISDAWKIVEKLFNGYSIEKDGKLYFVKYHYGGYDNDYDILSKAETAPHAICLAAIEILKEQKRF